jgi:hypothetical protein
MKDHIEDESLWGPQEITIRKPDLVNVNICEFVPSEKAMMIIDGIESIDLATLVT